VSIFSTTIRYFYVLNCSYYAQQARTYETRLLQFLYNQILVREESK
jgi:hypothetical protein